MVTSVNADGLRADRDIQKLLISTTSRLVGEYVSDDLLVTHAWPHFHHPQSHSGLWAGPHSRNAFMVVVKTEPQEPSIIVPDYTFIGDLICAQLSILFGKRFDNHGPIENYGAFQLPDYSPFQTLSSPQLPQNSHDARKDLAIPLNLEEFKRVAPVLFGETTDARFSQLLVTAGAFYLQALQGFERRPTLAYLDLVTAGEVLSSYFEYDSDELLDEDTRTVLEKIGSASLDGPSHVSFIKSRLRQIKRRFVKTIDRLITEQFFANSESLSEFHKLSAPGFSERIGAAYDLRSRYLHTGSGFNGWINPIVAKVDSRSRAQAAFSRAAL